MLHVTFPHSSFQNIVTYKSGNETIKKYKVGKQTLRHEKRNVVHVSARLNAKFCVTHHKHETW